MGHDEHGPAYPGDGEHDHFLRQRGVHPEPPAYRCPVCNDGDATRYLRCDYPMCPDGRDPGHPHARLFKKYDPIYDPCREPNAWERKQRGPWPAIQTGGIWLIGLTLLFWLFMVQHAPAMDHGFNPNSVTTKWFERLIRPDQPPNSCCGKGDAYPVERYEHHPSDHTYSVWLSDGSAIKYPDGTRRDYFDKSVEIVVPENKVNALEDDLDNPTDASWIFMRVSTPTDVGTIYCLIRHPEGN